MHEHHKERESAFRAINDSVPIPVIADNVVKVLFPTEQFDLEGEYHSSTSTFKPHHHGVYLIIGEIGFQPDNPNVSYRARVEIHVNSSIVAAVDNDFFGPSSVGNAVSVSAILKLHAGDRVEVFATADTNGTIIGAPSNPVTATNFQAARFPS